jgi:hypothetical protein
MISSIPLKSCDGGDADDKLCSQTSSSEKNISNYLPIYFQNTMFIGIATDNGSHAGIPLNSHWSGSGLDVANAVARDGLAFRSCCEEASAFG